MPEESQLEKLSAELDRLKQDPSRRATEAEEARKEIQAALAKSEPDLSSASRRRSELEQAAKRSWVALAWHLSSPPTLLEWINMSEADRQIILSELARLVGLKQGGMIK